MYRLLKTVWLSAIHLYVPQSIVIPRINHGSKDRVSHFWSRAQSTL